MPPGSVATTVSYRMPSRIIFLVLTLAALLCACGRNYPPPPKLPDPIVNQRVGPGDVIEIVVVGEEKLPKEYEIQGDGSLDFPYVPGIVVSGLEPRQIAVALRDKLVEAKYLVDPQ